MAAAFVAAAFVAAAALFTSRGIRAAGMRWSLGGETPCWVEVTPHVRTKSIHAWDGESGRRTAETSRKNSGHGKRIGRGAAPEIRGMKEPPAGR